MNKLDSLIKNNFIESLSTITGVSTEKLEDYAKDNDVFNVIRHPKIINPTKAQLRKIELLNEFISSYKVLQKNSEINKVQINGPERVVDYLISLYGNSKDKERFSVVFLNTKNVVIEVKTLFEGSIDSAAVYPREIAKQALDNNSSALILCHNHPSGNTDPSSEDLNITRKIVDALGTLGIRVLDHIIVGDDKYYSFVENATMPKYNAMHQSVSENIYNCNYTYDKKTLNDIKLNVENSKSKMNSSIKSTFKQNKEFIK